MFSSALKSFSSNITSNYSLSPSAVAQSGPWKIYDAKKKSTAKAVSVFVFERKALDPHSGLGRSGGSGLKRVHEEAIERLKKEASSLARLRHPSILELVEPVEDTRNGGLMFATEQVTASLASLLEEKDVQERAGGGAGRASRYVVEDANGGRRRREVEIDELEIQKGLLQIGKALEFLHESAGLVHGNLTPDAILINAKSDWKVSGLGFSGPPDDSTASSSVAPISLSEVLHHDPRLPRSIQLDLDYSSPDFVLDSSVTPSADMFTLGLLIIALYNSPHASPLQTNGSSTTYKRLFSSSSTTPTQNNQFLSSRPLPKDLTASVLPRLITRRPAQRLTAREFQQSQYFDNVLVSTIRFLDSLPAKTPNEKAQFMRGLARVLPQFPNSVLEKKVLPALLEEMKDRDLLSLILQNVFKIVKMMPSGKRAFTEKAMPKLKEVFLAGGSSSTKGPAERDTGKEAGLMIIIENMGTIIESCSARDFKDDMLPILQLAIESSSHSIVDASFRSLPNVLPALDFSTIKNELFPKVATVFTKTSSLGIKVRGLEAFTVLCGGSNTEPASTDDGLDGIIAEKSPTSKKSSNTGALDKYTMQEKVVPLLKAIKTKEPAVMMAALNVIRQVGGVVDCDFVATDILPLLWSMALGPLLNLQQFQTFMSLVKSLSNRVEQEQTRKLQELSSNSASESRNSRADDIMSFSAVGGLNGTSESNEDDFERLVLGKQSAGAQNNAGFDTGWDSMPSAKAQTSQPSSRSDAPVFSWSTPSASIQGSGRTGNSATMGVLSAKPAPSSRSITPDLSGYATLTPAGGTGGQSMGQPLQSQHSPWATQRTTSSPSLTTNLSKPASALGQTSSTLSNTSSAFSIPPPPLSSNNSFHGPNQSNAPSAFSAFSVPPPPIQSLSSGQQSSLSSAFGASTQNGGPTPSTSQPKSGLDKYESLL